jgi:DNA modification methylase
MKETENIEIIQLDISDLKPAEYNPRQATQKEYEDLEKSIERFGIVDPIIINSAPNRFNIVIGGHFRLRVLKDMGRRKVPCVYVNVPEIEKERELNLRLNKNLGEWDFDLLANFDEELLKDVGFESKELDRIFQLDTRPEDDDVPEARTTDIKLGDMFKLGEHRLLCGDATKREDVEKLIQGEKARICLTDPPYSVNYKSRKEKVSETLASYQDPKNADELLYGFMSILPSDVLIMTYADKQLHPYVLTCEKLDFETIDLLIWCKQNFCFWPGARYQQQHELIFIARREGEQIIDNVPSNQGTVFNIDRKKKNNIHPTQKPLELFEKLLLNHTNRDDIVYEPFGGSGTTLITCEKNNRKCRVIEISPQFCQVIIDRWEKYINAKATKIN